MILSSILQQTKKDLSARMQAVSTHELFDQIAAQEPARDFVHALSSKDTINIIAEVKKASPSRGVIRADFEPVSIARCYAENGARAISVLTEEHFFQGSLEYLKHIRRCVPAPLLRKDFIIDPYQVYEARAAGADALLLIAAVLDQSELCSLERLARSLGMHALIEVHTLDELTKALHTNPSIIGVNNRNLNTFKIDIETSMRLRPQIPETIIAVSESGIHSPEDIRRLRTCGIDAFLIGESLMRERDPGQKLSQLLGTQ